MSKFLKPLRLALLAGAVDAICAASSASAQDYGRTDEQAATGPAEQVIVISPIYRAERHTLGLPGTVSLSREVSYSDLDLTTRDGARALRARVRDMARDVCDELRDADPVREQPGATKCYEGAYKNGMLRVGDAIRDARHGGYYEARYRE